MLIKNRFFSFIKLGIKCFIPNFVLQDIHSGIEKHIKFISLHQPARLWRACSTKDHIF